MEKLWRPQNWVEIKAQIREETQQTFSPSVGFKGGSLNDVMEKTASLVIEAVMAKLDADKRPTEVILHKSGK